MKEKLYLYKNPVTNDWIVWEKLDDLLVDADDSVEVYEAKLDYMGTVKKQLVKGKV